ncbi:MAG: type II toxin-antitoxin system RelE/ParE family toxin [Pyrinomonadaceae bacterium]
MKVRFSSAANRDVRGTLEYYNREAGAVVSMDFHSELTATIERIKQWPKSFPSIHGDLRRAILKKFPYQIVYRIESSEAIAIYAIRHHKQHPDFGLRR